jgi:hypothetical protein
MKLCSSWLLLQLHHTLPCQVYHTHTLSHNLTTLHTKILAHQLTYRDVQTALKTDIADYTSQNSFKKVLQNSNNSFKSCIESACSTTWEHQDRKGTSGRHRRGKVGMYHLEPPSTWVFSFCISIHLSNSFAVSLHPQKSYCKLLWGNFFGIHYLFQCKSSGKFHHKSLEAVGIEAWNSRNCNQHSRFQIQAHSLRLYELQ